MTKLVQLERITGEDLEQIRPQPLGSFCDITGDHISHGFSVIKKTICQDLEAT